MTFGLPCLSAHTHSKACHKITIIYAETLLAWKPRSWQALAHDRFPVPLFLTFTSNFRSDLSPQTVQCMSFCPDFYQGITKDVKDLYNYTNQTSGLKSKRFHYIYIKISNWQLYFKCWIHHWFNISGITFKKQSSEFFRIRLLLCILISTKGQTWWFQGFWSMSTGPNQEPRTSWDSPAPKKINLNVTTLVSTLIHHHEIRRVCNNVPKKKKVPGP